MIRIGVASCAHHAWIESSFEMGNYLANAIGEGAKAFVHTPVNASGLMFCLKATAAPLIRLSVLGMEFLRTKPTSTALPFQRAFCQSAQKHSTAVQPLPALSHQKALKQLVTEHFTVVETLTP